MNKQELIEALTAKGVSFDKSAKVDELRNLLDAHSIDLEIADVDAFTPKLKAKYVKNTTNGRVFEATEELLKLPEMIAIDETDYNAALAG